jgi:hypothetical protein
MSRQLEQRLQEQYAIYLHNNQGLFCASAGGMRVSYSVAKKMKRAGYIAGHPDITIYEPRGPWHGMTVELKVEGKPSPEQIQWRDELRKRGYYAVIVPKLDFWKSREWLEIVTERYLQGQALDFSTL